MNVIVVVEDRGDWSAYYPARQLLTAAEYLASPSAVLSGRSMVINLCRNYRYLSSGYYCSLLAEARGHRVLPSVRTVNDLSRKALYGLHFEVFESALDKAMRKHHGSDSRLTIRIFFGQTEHAGLADLARQIFDQLPCPILQVEFRRRSGWDIASVKPIGLHQLTKGEEDIFAAALERFNAKIWRKPAGRRKYRYDLAMLVNEKERMPPSNRGALKSFVKAGAELGINVELIDKADYSRLAEYDALFIRETTALADHTYQFARKAEQEAMVVMDDPGSILRCANKIYLAELMHANKVAVPETRLLYRDMPLDIEALVEALGLPVVIKIPDGSFSRGMVRADNRDSLREAIAVYFRQSAVVLAQQFMLTDFDWRIGVLNQKPLFACQYFMSKGHWQIYHHKVGGKTEAGLAQTLAVQHVPPAVLKVALKAARLMGDGLYGVDLKQTGDHVVVVEVNDNPNIDKGVEDGWLGSDLYRQIMLEFLRRLEAKRLGLPVSW